MNPSTDDHDLLIRLMERHEAAQQSINNFGQRLGAIEQEVRLHTQELSGLRERLRQAEEHVKRLDIDVDVLREQGASQLSRTNQQLQEQIDGIQRLIERRETQFQLILWLGGPVLTILAGTLAATIQHYLFP